MRGTEISWVIVLTTSSTEIPKTLPMRNKVSRSNPHHYEVSYMLPAEFAENPPGPIDLRITISREDETLYAVK
ncbi:hypothetical protein TNCT_474241 [Trichonephila clavata]|uniref:Uncharacterized protein n=1 Tax=Trichonephila clavata TaxID=2740835 RepID=A0A8X6L1Q3_TRICU|nr:hypothetical protein TNCT_474241 [Trichonephila clavata]